VPFSSGDKALIKDLYRFKKYSFWIIMAEFLKINCNRKSAKMLLRLFWKHAAPTNGMRLAD